MGALRVTICEFIGISCYTRASVSKARPTTHQQNRGGVRMWMIFHETIWKHACSLLALGGRLVLLSLAQNYSVRVDITTWLVPGKLSSLHDVCHYVARKKAHEKPSKPYTIHQPLEVSERAWREVFLKQTSTNINKRIISDPILKSLDSHSSKHTAENFPKVPRGEWVSFPAQICRCRLLAKGLNLGISFLKGPVKGRFS